MQGEAEEKDNPEAQRARRFAEKKGRGARLRRRPLQKRREGTMYRAPMSFMKIHYRML
jgi:hypothetical protein